MQKKQSKLIYLFGAKLNSVSTSQFYRLPSCISRTLLGFWIILVQMIFAIRYDVDLLFIIHYYLLIIFLLIVFLSSKFNLQKLNKISEMLWIALCSSFLFPICNKVLFISFNSFNLYNHMILFENQIKSYIALK